MQTLFRSILLGSLLLAFICGASAAPVNTILKLPYTIKKAGVYVLKKDLAYAAPDGAAITVMADDVTIDFGGRTLSRIAVEGETVSAQGISANGRKRLTVRNGTIRSFHRGISAVAGEAIRVREMTVDTCLNAGIYLTAGQRALVENCNIRDIGGTAETIQWGIACIAPESVIRGNVVVNVSGPGVRAIQADSGSIVERNEVLNPDVQPNSVGIIMFNAHNLAVNNRVIRFFQGINCINGSLGSYRDNITAGCTSPYVGGTNLGDND